MDRSICFSIVEGIIESMDILTIGGSRSCRNEGARSLHRDFFSCRRVIHTIDCFAACSRVPSDALRVSLVRVAFECGSRRCVPSPVLPDLLFLDRELYDTRFHVLSLVFRCLGHERATGADLRPDAD